MQLTVYWDVLWAVNFILDSVLLACTAFLMAKKLSFIKNILAAAFGATYALSPLFETTALLYHPILKIVIAFVMVAIAMTFTTGLDYLKTTLLFFLVSFLAGGMAMAFNSLGEDIFMFTQAKFVVLTLTVVAFLLLIKTGYFRMRAILMRSACKLIVRICIEDKLSETTAIIDTGNELACPVTGKPIIIMDSQALINVLPPELIQCEDFSGLIKLSDRWKSRVQILPYTALGTQGMLIAVRPDKAEIAFINSDSFTEVHALVGIAKHGFCKDKNYNALVSSQLLPSVGGAVA